MEITDGCKNNTVMVREMSSKKLDKLTNKKAIQHGNEEASSSIEKEFALKPIETTKSYFAINRFAKENYRRWVKRNRV